MLELKTNQLKTRKKRVIDGHLYTVRRLGNIEQMDLSQYIGRLDALSKLEKEKELTAGQLNEVQDIGNKISNLFIGLFDDGGDQSKSRALVSSLSESDIGEIMEEIFGDNTVKAEQNGETPEAS